MLVNIRHMFLSTPTRSLWPSVRPPSIYPRVKLYGAGLGVTGHQATTLNTWDIENLVDHVSVKLMEFVVVLFT